jgi:hypothetical protein
MRSSSGIRTSGELRIACKSILTSLAISGPGFFASGSLQPGCFGPKWAARLFAQRLVVTETKFNGLAASGSGELSASLVLNNKIRAVLHSRTEFDQVKPHGLTVRNTEPPGWEWRHGPAEMP